MEKYNRLEIVETFTRKHYNQNATFAKCICECGKIVYKKLSSVKNGETKSCGCLKNELASDRCKKQNFVHGFCQRVKNRKPRIYRIWQAMKTRCYNSNSKPFKDYGRRGITICEEWLNDFTSFLNWSNSNGYKENLSIDRIDVNKDYCPANCRWTDMKIQANNKRNSRCSKINITAFQETKSVSEWLLDSRCMIKSGGTIFYRIGCGWSPEDAISKPSERGRKNTMENNICPNCDGSGKTDDGPCSPPGVCSQCNGAGRIKDGK